MEHLGLSRLEFSKALGMPSQTRFRRILNEGKIPQPSDLERILFKFPQISIDWLFDGTGEMLKPEQPPQTGHNQGIGSIGHITGGVNSFNSNGGKDKVIEKLEEKDDQRQNTMSVHIQRFHERMESKNRYIERKDDYIKKQDDYIASIVKHSYLRNQENMERIDKAMEQQNNIIAQQNKLIELVFEQSKRTQDRADALIEVCTKQAERIAEITDKLLEKQ
jgi:hypothetical protein